MILFRAAMLGAVFLLLGTLFGCGGSMPIGEVNGTVTLDGVPVDGGSIEFRPAEGPTAGCLIEAGKYSAEVPAGISEVQIIWARPTGKKRRAFPDDKSPFIVETREAIPSKYNQKSTLTIDVKPGKNEKNFELTTK